MSWRTWLGEGKMEFADYNLSEYPSMEDLARDVVMTGPSRLFAPSREVVTEFLEVMKREYGSTLDDFWTVIIKTDDGWEDYNHTPTAKFIEMGEVIQDFFKAIGCKATDEY